MNMLISEENENKLYNLSDLVIKLTGQEPQDEHDLLRLIRENNLSIANEDFPEGSYDAFVKAVADGRYDIRELDRELDQEMTRYMAPANFNETLADDIVAGRASLLAPPSHPVWKLVEEKRRNKS